MKLAIASLLIGSAAAFAPAATPMRNSALNMATETTTEKVRSIIANSKASIQSADESWSDLMLFHDAHRISDHKYIQELFDVHHS